MSDCGVCLSDGDYDAPTLYDASVVKARKQYKCGECYREIKIGDKYERAKGLWEGHFSVHRTCLDCVNIRAAFDCGGFIFNMMWETLSEYRNDINTGCLERIKTPSAKAYYLERLREMRGIDE